MPQLVSTDGTAIAYEAIGAGPAVVVVDGAMCFRDAGPARAVAAALSDRFTVYVYDRRGRGESDDALPYSVDREIEDLDALVTHAGGTVALFGVSSGGALALRAAAALGPERVSAIAVYEPPYMPEPALPAAAQYTRELRATLEDGRPSDAVELFLRRVGVPDAGIAGMRQSPGWSGMVALAPTLAYDAAALGDSSVPVDLAATVRVPTLALAGGASPLFLRHGAEGIASTVPGARLEIVEGQTHDFSADAIAPLLIEFFARPE